MEYYFQFSIGCHFYCLRYYRLYERWVAKPLLDMLNIYPEAFESIWGGNFLYWIIRILIVFPAYQVLLLFFGAVFFQFRFFWNFEKKILKRIGFKSFFKDD